MTSLVLLGLVALTLFLSYVVVPQGSVAVITTFGKYRRIMMPGLNFKIPFIEAVYKRISVQNRSLELEFQAITIDQANVNFKAMLVYGVLNQDERTIQNVAFKFVDERSLMQALVRTVEGSAAAGLLTTVDDEQGSLIAGTVLPEAPLTHQVRPVAPWRP